MNSIYPFPVDGDQLVKAGRETLDCTLDERLARIMRNEIERRIIALPPDDTSSLRSAWPVVIAAVVTVLSFAAVAIFVLSGRPGPVSTDSPNSAATQPHVTAQTQPKPDVP